MKASHFLANNLLLSCGGLEKNTESICMFTYHQVITPVFFFTFLHVLLCIAHMTTFRMELLLLCQLCLLVTNWSQSSGFERKDLGI